MKRTKKNPPGKNPEGSLSDKQASISRVLYDICRDGHFSRGTIARTFQQPTRGVFIEMALSPLLGLAPAGVCHAARVATGAVSSYLTFSPLPPERCGLFSVALSVAVIQHRAQALPGSFAKGARTFLDLVP